ncbi:MAG: hypothetical protein HYR83_05915 [Planctomycetes bacterium]|nr:hypothetical protein [Planctomycetota bacterium]
MNQLAQSMVVPDDVLVLRTNSSGDTLRGVTDTHLGVNVYRNDDIATNFAFRPGADQRLADDMHLLGGGGNLVYYELLVIGSAAGGSPFDTHVELWTDDPCLPASSVILGTQSDFINTPNSSAAQSLEVTFDPPIAIPSVVWMALTFSGAGAADAAWVEAGPAEIGTTDTVLSHNTPLRCERLVTPIQGQGLWARIDVEFRKEPVGACCDLTWACHDAVTPTDCDGRWDEGASCAAASFDPPCGKSACCPPPVQPFQPICHNLTEEECSTSGGGYFLPGESCTYVGCSWTRCPFCSSHPTYCYGGTWCNPLQDCAPVELPPADCDDDEFCTIDSCDEAGQRCTHTPYDEFCNDGIACTVDTCNEAARGCDHTPSDALCDDGDPCTTDTCTPTGCVHQNVCGSCCNQRDGACTEAVLAGSCTCSQCVWTAGGSCSANQCQPQFIPIPTVSTWGTAIIGLILLIGLKIRFGGRRESRSRDLFRSL